MKKPGIRLATHRRLGLPAIGEIRLHESAKRLARLIDREQAVIQSVTVSRSGHRWYAFVLCKVSVSWHRRVISSARTSRVTGRAGAYAAIVMTRS
ncbi:hypothetical protein [Streptomyces sp. NPDC056544]|uniref:hypothetical protein n=1 Tax=unclassified Streptomyces TaxID=2593676 RepID=UPI0036AD41FB